ncbi:hypothetical protein ABH941_001976 [Streptacidiphilus sp. EB103A]
MPVMGRQKQNKPRRERSIGPGNAIAGMLDLPSVISHGETDVVLDVAAVGLAGDDLADDRPAYIRLSGGSVKLLPEGLRPWARDIVARDLVLRAAGEASLFPCRIGFGVTDGAAYAALL